MLELTDDEWFARLNSRRMLQAHESISHWRYYDNQQPLAFIAKILQEQGDRFPPLRLNWSAVVIDSAEERLDVEGFRLRGASDFDEDLMNVWHGNDLNELSGEAHLASMVSGASYLMIGPGIDSNIPRITVEYGDQVAVEVDPGTGNVVAALKVWSSDTANNVLDQAVLYLPGKVVTYQSGTRVGSLSTNWTKQLEQFQTSPLVPVIPMYNKPRRGRGRTELGNIIPIVDAVNQTATNMMAALEHHALPRRWAVNVAESDFQDANGQPLPAWAIATGAVWAIPRAEDDGTGTQPQPAVGQFTGAALDNFHNSVRLLALQASSQYGLSSSAFGYATDNPASADAINANAVRLIKRVERHQQFKGGSWTRTMRVVLAMLERDPADAMKVETIWRDASTPTKSAQAQAAMELVNAGIIDREQAREDLGYSIAQREAIANRATGLDMNTVIANLRKTSTTADPVPDPTGVPLNVPTG